MRSVSNKPSRSTNRVTPHRIGELAAGAIPDAWTRGLTIGTERTEVCRLIEHGLHDSVHHLDDVERGPDPSVGTSHLTGTECADHSWLDCEPSLSFWTGGPKQLAIFSSPS